MGKRGGSVVWSKEKIENAFAAFVEKNGRLPVAREMNPQCGLPSRRTFEHYMGMSAQEFAACSYPELLQFAHDRHTQSVLAYRSEVKEWSIQQLIEAERAFFLEHGRLPERCEYTAENGLPMYSVFCRLAKESFEEVLKAEFQELPLLDGQVLTM